MLLCRSPCFALIVATLLLGFSIVTLWSFVCRSPVNLCRSSARFGDREANMKMKSSSKSRETLPLASGGEADIKTKSASEIRETIQALNKIPIPRPSPAPHPPIPPKRSLAFAGALAPCAALPQSPSPPAGHKTMIFRLVSDLDFRIGFRHLFWVRIPTLLLPRE